MPKPRILVHVCYTPDTLYVFGLLKENYDVAGFFSNSNIHPREEYELRLEEARKVARTHGVPLIKDDYDPDGWLLLTRKFKDEPEKGRRCDVCYAARLGRTAERAAREGFDAFATVMSLSPWKKGRGHEPDRPSIRRPLRPRLPRSGFQKKDGFKKSVDLSRAHGLYRQGYCGCLYSLAAAEKRSP